MRLLLLMLTRAFSLCIQIFVSRESYFIPHAIMCRLRIKSNKPFSSDPNFPIVFHQWDIIIIIIFFFFCRNRAASTLIGYYLPVDFRLTHSVCVRISSNQFKFTLIYSHSNDMVIGLKRTLRSFGQLLGCNICRYNRRPVSEIQRFVCGFSKKPYSERK